MESNFTGIANINKYKTPEVRDLVWCLLSKSLQHKDFSTPEWPPVFYQEFYDHIKDQLTAIDQNPTVLLQFLEQHNTKLLGSYYEYLVYYLLEMHPDFQIIAFQEQISDGHVTKGELDFIVENKKSNTYFHIETAVKFYLGSQKEDNDQMLWYGPNARDRLDLKFKKLMQKQLPMIAHSKFSKLPIHSRTWIKGGLFAPVNATPDLCQQYSCIGQWISYTDFASLYRQQPFAYKILRKKRWLSGIYNNKAGIEQNLTPVSNHFLKGKRKYALLIQSAHNNALLFIVSDQTALEIMPEF